MSSVAFNQSLGESRRGKAVFHSLLSLSILLDALCYEIFSCQLIRTQSIPSLVGPRRNSHLLLSSDLPLG